MRNTFFFTSALLINFFGTTVLAEAACQRVNPRFYFQGDEHTVQMKCDSRGTWHAHTTRGTYELTALSVAKHPKSGKLAPRDGAGWSFVPNPGFAGADSFSIKICGRGRGGEGCSVMHYQVTVQPGNL